MNLNKKIKNQSFQKKITNFYNQLKFLFLINNFWFQNKIKDIF